MSTTTYPAPAAGRFPLAACPREPRQFPQPWQRVVAPNSAGRACYGTVTFTCCKYFDVLLDGEKRERFFSNANQVHWTPADDTGTLPMWFFDQPGDDRLTLQRVNYDLVLMSGERVQECFFKSDRFLEIGGAHRHIALADVARLRPSA